MRLSSSNKIEDVKTEPGSVSIFWLSQAGFIFKDSMGRVVVIDPYFSDVVERTFGFKRMMRCPISVDDIVPDLVICTHEHLDHMDTDALPMLAKNPRTHFAGPIACWEAFREMGVPEMRCRLLEEGKTITVAGLSATGVYADHGEFAPDALGVVVDFPDARVYHTGDTAYRPKEFAPAIALQPDILLPCINGRFGNRDPQEAALLTQSVSPKLVIPCHFWMFVVHNGDPGLFVQECEKLAPQVQCMVPKPGEEIVFRKAEKVEAEP